MIELKVEDYCQECKAFSPVSTTTEYFEQYSYDSDFNVTERIPAHTQTTVKCKYAKRCAGIARHIRKEMGEHERTE